MKILLVDDEVELVSAMAERLSIRGLDADWTDNGISAQEWPCRINMTWLFST